MGGTTDPTIEIDPDSSSGAGTSQLAKVAVEERTLREAVLRISALEDEEALLREGLGDAFSLLQADAAALYLTSEPDARPRCRVIQRHDGVEILPEAGAQGFVAKPFSPAALLVEVENALLRYSGALFR